MPWLRLDKISAEAVESFDCYFVKIFLLSMRIFIRSDISSRRVSKSQTQNFFRLNTFFNGTRHRSVKIVVLPVPTGAEII